MAVPMFPLGAVLVPSVVAPIHVFEPRYRAMTRDCLAGDREFGVVLIERGSEVGGGDVRLDVGTLAHILEADELDDGRWILHVVGVRRLRVVRWLPDDPYPRAEVDPWDDPPPGDIDDELDACSALARRVLALHVELGRPVPAATFELADDPSVASHQLCALSPLGPIDRQTLLVAQDIGHRLSMLRRMLGEEEQVVSQLLADG